MRSLPLLLIIWTNRYGTSYQRRCSTTTTTTTTTTTLLLTTRKQSVERRTSHFPGGFPTVFPVTLCPLSNYSSATQTGQLGNHPPPPPMLTSFAHRQLQPSLSAGFRQNIMNPKVFEVLALFSWATHLKVSLKKLPAFHALRESRSPFACSRSCN